MRRETTINAKVRSLAFWCLVTGLATLAVLISVLSWHYGSLPLAMAKLRGERFVLSPAEIDLGDCDPRTQHTAKLTLTNLTARPLRVVGTEEGCSCITLGELPIVAAPGEARDITVRATLPASGGYSQKMLLYVDDGRLQTLVVRIRARVRQNKPKSVST
jgi:hypothetical protein